MSAAALTCTFRLRLQEELVGGCGRQRHHVDELCAVSFRYHADMDVQVLFGAVFPRDLGIPTGQGGFDMWWLAASKLQ